jgi:hypothetical protein
MMAHELLRQAALILADGWSHNANARDNTGRIVPLFAGSGRAAINPEATKFSPYGAICKAASQVPRPQLIVRGLRHLSPRNRYSDCHEVQPV